MEQFWIESREKTDTQPIYPKLCGKVATKLLESSMELHSLDFFLPCGIIVVSNFYIYCNIRLNVKSFHDVKTQDSFFFCDIII